MAGRPRFSIPTRIFLGFALVVVAFAAVAVSSVVQHERTTRTLRLLHEGYLPLALTVGEARATQAVFATLLDRVLQEQDTTATRSWLDTARRVRPATLQRALAGVKRAQQLDPPPEDRETLARVKRELEAVDEAYAQTDARYNQLFRALEQGNDARAASLLDELRSRERSIQRNFRQAWEQLQQRITTTSSRVAQQERRAAIVLGLLTLLAIAVGVLATLWSQRVLKPLPALHERVQAVARGDLSRRLEPRSDDELGRLTREFERMVETLAARDARLREAADAQRRLQRMQEQIIASLSAAILVIDADRVIRTVNPAARQVLGLGEDAVGTSLEASRLPARLPGLREELRRVAQGEDRAVLEAAEIDGGARYVDVLVTPFGGDDDGRSWLVVAEDVTEELETKRRLIHTERLAAIGKMAAHVTHEVRNPLSSIGLNVEMLEEELANSGVAGAEARALTQAIQKEMDRLRGITDEYLRVARLPAPQLEREDAGELVTAVADFVRPEMEAAGVDLQVEVERDLPPVAMDEQQLRQALLNLLRNAREAMPEGGRAGLEARADDEGVCIRVWDEGGGIEAEARERMFDLFYTTKERGTGLGLPLTQQIVVAHAGEIRCEPPALGRGTVFAIRLPAARAAEGQAVAEPRSAAG